MSWEEIRTEAAAMPELECIRDVVLDEKNYCEEIAEAVKQLDEGKRIGVRDALLAKEWFRDELCFGWARYVGDREVMRGRVTDSKWAFWWAYFLDEKDVMRNRITDSEWAFWWARYIGDREVMRDRVTDSEWAFWWAYFLDEKS